MRLKASSLHNIFSDDCIYVTMWRLLQITCKNITYEIFLNSFLHVRLFNGVFFFTFYSWEYVIVQVQRSQRLIRFSLFLIHLQRLHIEFIVLRIKWRMNWIISDVVLNYSEKYLQSVLRYVIPMLCKVQQFYQRRSTLEIIFT